MGAVSSVVSAVTSVVNKAVDVVDSAVKSALDDPIKTALTVAAVATGQPELIPYINAADATIKGQSLGDIAKSAAISYAGGELGSQVGSSVPTDYAPLAGQATSGAAQAAMRGQDLEKGALSGLVGGATTNAAKSISDQNFEDWAKEQASNTYDNAPSPTEQDVLARDPSIKMDSPLSTASTDTGAGYYDETTGKFIPSDIGGLSSPLNDLSGTNTMPDSAMDDLGKLSGGKEGVSGSDLLSEEVGMSPESYDPALTKGQIKYGLGMLANAYMHPSTSAQPRTGLSGLPSQASNQIKPQSDQIGSPKLLAGSDITGDSTGDPYYLQHLRQIYGTLTPNEVKMADISQQEPKMMANGGLAESSTTTESVFPIAKTGIGSGILTGGGQRKGVQITPLQQLSQTIVKPRMAAGGALDKYAHAMPKGHNPEFITGLTGYYASGKGTGQSDDIDAMLHDGDYVADADLVAALGDGSSKAGAEALEKFRRQVPHQEHAEGGQPVAAKIADGEYVFPASFVTAIGQGDNKAGAKILDKMREAIRAHKRSAPTTKIPPKAKSPLEYLKMAKG
jgi:hypothetical protein